MLPRALYGPRMANLPDNRLLLTGGSSGDLSNEVGGGNNSCRTNFFTCFLKVYELSLPDADSWVLVSKAQNSTSSSNGIYNFSCKVLKLQKKRGDCQWIFSKIKTATNGLEIALIDLTFVAFSANPLPAGWWNGGGSQAACSSWPWLYCSLWMRWEDGIPEFHMQ